MPKYAVAVQDATYEVDAPDENTAWNWAVATHTAAKPAAPTQAAPPQEAAPQPAAPRYIRRTCTS